MTSGCLQHDDGEDDEKMERYAGDIDDDNVKSKSCYTMTMTTNKTTDRRQHQPCDARPYRYPSCHTFLTFLANSCPSVLVLSVNFIVDAVVVLDDGTFLTIRQIIINLLNLPSFLNLQKIIKFLYPLLLLLVRFVWRTCCFHFVQSTH